MLFSHHRLRLLALCAVSVMGVACTHVRAKLPEGVLGKKSAESAAQADTSDLTQGRVDFSRYTTPAACERAVENTRFVVTRGKGMVKTIFAPEQDTLPTEAIEVGRACVKNFTVQTTAPDQLFYLARLSFMIGDEHQAIAATLRQVSLAESDSARGEVLKNAVQLALDAVPMRLQTAEFFAQLLEQQVPTAYLARLQAHHLLLGYYATIFDIPKIRTESNIMIEIVKHLTPDQVNTFAAIAQSPFLYLAIVLTYESGPASALELLAKATDSLPALRAAQSRTSMQWVIRSYINQAKLYGKMAPPLVGQLYGMDSSTERPQEGHVSLFVTVDMNCGTFCQGQYALLNRLYQRYSAQGLDITLIAKAVGFTRRGVIAPDDEVDSIRSYFLSQLNLPVTLLIQQTPYTILPDGRRSNERSPFAVQYEDAALVLVDRHRIIHWTTPSFHIGQEAILKAYVQRALGEE